MVSGVGSLLAGTDGSHGVRPLPPLQLEVGRAAPELHLWQDEARGLKCKGSWPGLQCGAEWSTLIGRDPSRYVVLVGGTLSMP